MQTDIIHPSIQFYYPVECQCKLDYAAVSIYKQRLAGAVGEELEVFGSRFLVYIYSLNNIDQSQS